MPLDPPPRNQAGQVIPHDHPGLANADGAIRRISEKHIIVDKAGQRRISSIAFKPSSGNAPGLSIDLENEIRTAGLDVAEFVTTPYWTGSVRMQIGAVRQLGLLVGSEPLVDNPHHGEIWGITNRAQQRSLQTMAVWFVQIPDAAVA